MNIRSNPFLVSGYHSPEYFCDRKTETDKIRSALINGRNITLISNRRIGKTALIEHVFNRFRGKSTAGFIHIDIYPTQNLTDFLSTLGKGIFKSGGSKTAKLMDTLTRFFSSIGANIVYDSVSGQPSFELKYHDPKRTAKSIDQLFDFLEKSGKQYYIALDEFQQISNYPEKNVEALLRSKIQHLKNVHFIFSGSHKHVLISMFSDYKRPFYQSTDLLFLDIIDPKIYEEFIFLHFRNARRQIKHESIQLILNWCRNHTYYVQYVCNRLFAKVLSKIDDTEVNAVFNEVLEESKATYFNYRNLLTDAQWNLLRAIANEEHAAMPTSFEFMKRYNLGAPSTINRSLNALLDKEMILKGENGYIVYDVFFSRWLERLQ
ncbi:MAG: ATP-binding protein [Bacteroidia bacterium]